MSDTETKVDETENFETATTDLPTVKADPQGDDKAKESAPEAKPETDGGDKPEENKDADGSNDAAKPEAKAKPKKGFQKRIGELTRERETERLARIKAEKELAETRKQLETKPKEAKAPEEADFETYDDYLAALDAHDKDQTEQKADEKAEEKPSEDDKAAEGGLTDEQKTAMAVVKEAVDSAEGKPDDFEDVALADDVHITGEMLEALAECDNPEKVMYALGKDKDLSVQIAGKTPAQQMREIAKLDLEQGKARTPKPVETTKAPDPIEPVGGADVQEKDPDKMSFKEYEAHRNKQERSRSAQW